MGHETRLAKTRRAHDHNNHTEGNLSGGGERDGTGVRERRGGGGRVRILTYKPSTGQIMQYQTTKHYRDPFLITMVPL